MNKELDEFIDEMDDLTGKLNNFINLTPSFDNKNESVVYALAEVIQDRIDNLDFSEEDKGAIVHALILGLAGFNEGRLALLRQRLKMMEEGKAATKH